MHNSKEITVFTIGDANELSAWSNVPYFFTKSLEEKNIKVNRVNIEENAFINFLYKYSIFAFLKLLYRNSDHTYFRSGLNNCLTNFKIKQAKKKHPDSHAFVFLTYSFGSKKKKTDKVVLFSDWSYLYSIKKLQNRSPYGFEKKALRREDKNIRNADLVLSLFPGSLEFNLENYPGANCHYLGNVINSVNRVDKAHLSSEKLKSNSILFIGNKKYLQGALDLIKAFKELKKNYSHLQLHIVGMDSADTQVEEDNLCYYGYLDKGNEAEKKIYYQLLSSAKCIVNTTKGWGAFSAMTEAMYYYTPVVTTAYSEFVKTYGESISFGFYVKSDEHEELIQAVENVFLSSEQTYKEMMEEAHNQVKSFTWQVYIEKLLALIS